MDVGTRLLRYFATVAAEGNLTRAAGRLFVSQPALTKQVRQLENQLGERPARHRCQPQPGRRRLAARRRRRPRRPGLRPLLPGQQAGPSARTGL